LSLGDTDGNTSKVEVGAKGAFSDDPQKIEESPPDAEGVGEFPLREAQQGTPQRATRGFGKEHRAH